MGIYGLFCLALRTQFTPVSPDITRVDSQSPAQKTPKRQPLDISIETSNMVFPPTPPSSNASPTDRFWSASSIQVHRIGVALEKMTPRQLTDIEALVREIQSRTPASSLK